jgi:hypothetical protein
MTTVAAVVSSNELVMVMALAVVVVSKQLDALHVHSPSSCGQRGQPDSAAGRALDGSAEQPPDSAWAA